MSEQVTHILRAMAVNYLRADVFDTLDSQALNKAADQIDSLHAEAEALRAENGRLQLASDCYRVTLRSVLKDIRDDIARGGLAESWNDVAATIAVVLEQGEAATQAPEVQAEQGERQEAIGKVLSEEEMGIGYDRKAGPAIWFGKPKPGLIYTSPQPGPDVRALVSAEDVRDACANAVSVFAEETNAGQCREVAEYMREVLLAQIARRQAQRPA